MTDSPENHETVVDQDHSNANGGETASVSTENSAKFGEIIGAAFWLMARSEQHRAAPLGAVADLILRGVETRQFRLWRQDGAPLAFVVWGLLDADAEKKLRGGITLEKEEMTSGDQAWIMTLISPFMPADTMLKDLRENQFKDRTLMTLV